MDEPPDVVFGRFEIRTFFVSAMAGAVVAGAVVAPVLLSSPSRGWSSCSRASGRAGRVTTPGA